MYPLLYIKYSIFVPEGIKNENFLTMIGSLIIDIKAFLVISSTPYNI